ncbi:hypothetical protein [Indibacter alkaliphilus]|uniref:hypothetical protein n=1 Tax=Indibacter alkaliphilus TaxID=579922 RepID=UPI00136221D2|nr:hypothetical protein [Indibacter alkaliphilus]
MRELSIEKMEMVNGGGCSMVEMMYYASQTTHSNSATAMYYTYKLWNCMSQI